MFGPIRWRLVGWTVMILCSILAIVGVATYYILSQILIDEVDRSLESQGEQVEERILATRGEVIRLDREGFRDGFFFLLLDPSGSVLSNPQSVDARSLGIHLPPGQMATYGTKSMAGSPIRWYARHIGPRPAATPIIVIGQSLTPEYDALSGVLQVLVLMGAGGIVLSIIGAWFLAGRALVPIGLAFRRQQEFIGDASHELRTPLTVLRSAHDLLERHRDEPLAANAGLLEDIRAEIARMERLTDDLLTLARSDQGSLYLEVADVDLSALASHVVSLASPLAEDRDITLAFEGQPNVPTFEGDPDRLEQVLLILIDNALKHTSAGGKVTVLTFEQGRDVVIAVSDTGAGIAPEHLPRLFDRFYRVDDSRARKYGGTGLGLAIAKSLVEAHGGQLTVTSALGVGTTVTVCLSANMTRVSLVDRFQSLAARVTELRP